ncbi:MAG: aldolase catalytic domain-containing protein [Synergistaceae bacterium]|nr:aldolase catalytic domain-containing protein [Synergistaceae bacterium]
MSSISVLDCTLRDGGYCNEWHFGFENAAKIARGLVEAGIDIIECGFLTNRVQYDPDITKFTDIRQVSRIIPECRKGKRFVVMVNYGEYSPEDLPEYDGSSVDGIRVAFHKRNLAEALALCEGVKAKGYALFVQAMVSLNYSDSEFLGLIERINALRPEAFYIVDSFGTMGEKDLTRLFYMVEHNLDENITIGFHSHNNLQLSYSNAQKLLSMHGERDMIIDSSVYGMGRGAGNLNTELFVEYLNVNAGKNYSIRPLLGIIDEILNGFYQRGHWGYSLPNYLSAVHGAHPNYAIYLDEKRTLTVKEMNEIFDSLDADKKISYDKNYIEQVYLDYMTGREPLKPDSSGLRGNFLGRTILLIAPGKSSETEHELIESFAAGHECITVSVNFEYGHVRPDFIFLSNLRRLRELGHENLSRCIATSNITAEGVFCRADYAGLIFPDDSVRDNAGLMAVKFFGDMGAGEIYLAGFDGYSHDLEENYGRSDMAFIARNNILDAQNEGMTRALLELSRKINVKFLTAPRHVNIQSSRP